MRVLVTGGAGFIGSHLVHRLVREGYDVIVLDNLSTGRRLNLRQVANQITFIEGDVRVLATCLAALKRVELVFHQAALGSVPRSVANPGETHDVNASGTLTLLRAMLECCRSDGQKRRMVYASSSSVYGESPGGSPVALAELSTLAPVSPYAVSKLAGELYCGAFWRTYGLEAVALRYFNVFGPRQDPRGQYAAVVPRFITAALEGQPMHIYGDGHQTRAFTYVDDVVNANLLAAAAPASRCGRAYNISGGRRTSVNVLAATVRAVVGGDQPEPVYEAARPGDVRDSWALLDTAASDLGYEPAVELREALDATVASYR